MTTHIEIQFGEGRGPSEETLNFLQRRLPEIEPGMGIYQQEFVKVSEEEYYFTVGKLPYLRYRRFLMEVCRKMLPLIPVDIIFDVSGDNEDERLVVSWDGEDFSFKFWCM
jgi:hypothetical protein